MMDVIEYVIGAGAVDYSMPVSLEDSKDLVWRSDFLEDGRRAVEVNNGVARALDNQGRRRNVLERPSMRFIASASWATPATGLLK